MNILPIGYALCQPQLRRTKQSRRLAIDFGGGNGLSFRFIKEVDLMQAYCMKCRAKQEMKDAKAITMKNGRPATQGVCPACGTKMFRIGKS